MKVGFFPLMFLIFMTLKLTGAINWSWWFVTIPLWGGFSFLFVAFLIVAIIKTSR